MKKSAGCLISPLICVVLICGCVDFHQDFEVHEWGVFVKGYDCDNTSALGKPPDIIYVEKPVIYFHNSGKMKVFVSIANIDNVTTIPPADVVNNYTVWLASIDNGYVVLPNGSKCRYLFYEGTINWSTKVRADITVSGNDVTFHVKNGENYTISDVYVVYGYPVDEPDYLHRGLTYIRIDEMCSGEERNITVELRNETSFDLDELAKSLVKRGLTEEEVQEMIDHWKTWWFYPANIGIYTRLIYVIPQQVYDELIPLFISPAPSSITRVGVVTITDIPVYNLNENVSLKLSLDRTVYHVNESVNISLSVINKGDRKICLTFPSAYIADFKVIDENGKLVYQWSHDKAFAQVITTIDLSPGESKIILNSFWNADVKRGNYTILGWLPSISRIYSEPVNIEIK